LHLIISFATAFRDIDLAAAAFDRRVKVQPLSWLARRRSDQG